MPKIYYLLLLLKMTISSIFFKGSIKNPIDSTDPNILTSISRNASYKSCTSNCESYFTHMTVTAVIWYFENFIPKFLFNAAYSVHYFYHDQDLLLSLKYILKILKMCIRNNYVPANSFSKRKVEVLHTYIRLAII